LRAEIARLRAEVAELKARPVAVVEAKAKDGGVQAREDAIREMARKKHGSEGEIEIDDNAKLSEGGDDNGCYVQGWLWVRFDGTPFDREAEEDDAEEDEGAENK
jgi:hypothetical protein